MNISCQITTINNNKVRYSNSLITSLMVQKEKIIDVHILFIIYKEIKMALYYDYVY